MNSTTEQLTQEVWANMTPTERDEFRRRQPMYKKQVTLEEWKKMSSAERKDVPIGLHPFEVLRIERKKSIFERRGDWFLIKRGYMGEEAVLSLEDVVAIVDGFDHYRRVKNEDKITNEELAAARRINKFDPSLRKNDKFVEQQGEQNHE